MTARPIPPTGAALLRLLADCGGEIAYRDPRATVSGLTALRHRGLARVEARTTGAVIVLTYTGRQALAAPLIGEVAP